MTAAEETRWTVGGGGATTVLMTTTKSNKQQVCGGKGRWMTTMAGKRRGEVVEVEERLFGGQWWLKRCGGQSVAEGQQQH
jgi:hypothetical protein